MRRTPPDENRSVRCESGPKESTEKPQRSHARHKGNANNLEMAGKRSAQRLSSGAAPNPHAADPPVGLASFAHLVGEQFDHFFSELMAKRRGIEKQQGCIDSAVPAQK